METSLNLLRLPVRYRIDFKVALLVFKLILACHLNIFVTWPMSKKNPTTACGLMMVHMLILAPRGKTKKSMGDHAFAVAAPKIWNELPLQIRNEANLDLSKKLLKDIFL